MSAQCLNNHAKILRIMPLNEKVLLTGYKVKPSQELEEETKEWRSGERIFYQESRLRKKGLKILAPPGVNVYEKYFFRIYRKEKELVHLVFAADTDNTYMSIVRPEDVQEDGRVILANAQYVGAFETLEVFIRDFKRGQLAHIRDFHRLRGNYPLAPEQPPKINTKALFFMFMGFAKGLVPRADGLLHKGVYTLVEDHPELEFDLGFFHMNFGYPFSNEMDQARMRMIDSGIFEWIDTETTYRTTMDREFLKESVRQRLGHHFDALFKRLAHELASNWTWENWEQEQKT